MSEFISSFEVDPDLSNEQVTSNVIPIVAQEDRVVIQNHVFEFSVDCFERKALIKSINAALTSEWFLSRSKQSQISYLSALKPFLSFLQSLLKEQFSTALLAEFVEYRVNVAKVKSQSTNVNPVALVIRHGLNHASFSSEQITYLRATLRNKPKTAKKRRKQVPLSDYFLNLSWFRTYLSDAEIYELTNQKNLIGSFTTAVAVVLINIINAKRSLSAFEIKDPASEHGELSKRSQQKKHVESLLKCCNQLQIESKVQFQKLLQVDVINESRHVNLDEQKEEGCAQEISFLNERNSYHAPDVLAYEHLNKPSHFEQCLISFLLAAQAIQPSNIKNLCAGNIIEVSNSRGELVQVYMKYYKTRAAQAKITPYLPYKSSIVAQAIVNYKKYFTDQSSCLFDSGFNPGDLIHFTPSSKTRTIVSRFINALRIYDSEIQSKLRQNGFTNILSKCFEILSESGGIPHSEWWTSIAENKGSKSYARYKSDIKNYLPTSFIRLNAIKTSAIYANADQFNQNSTQNFNSHSNATELQHYLNDQNQDWQDRNGQVTRLVFNDMQNYAFRPTDNPAIDSVSSLVNRTIIKSSPESGQRVPNAKGYVNSSQEEKSEGVERVVIDSAETVVLLKHYIEQAHRFSKELLQSNQVFFEWEVLPNAEWAETMLAQKLPPKTVRRGIELYRAIKHKLPDLFTQKIEGLSH